MQVPITTSQKTIALLQTILFSTVFVLIVSFREREIGNDSVDWQVAMRLVFLAICAGVSALYYKAWAYKLLIKENFLLIPFFIILFASSLYAPSLAYSAGCTFSLMAVFSLFFTCSNVIGERRTISTIITVCTLVSLISLIVYFIMPDIGKATAWQGDIEVPTKRLAGITGPNGAGYIAAVTLLLITILKRRGQVGNPLLCLFFVSINFAVLMLSESRTSAIAMITALCCLFFFKLSKARLAILFGGIALIIFMFFSIDADQALSMLSRSGDASEVTTGTGRLYIWKTAVELISQHPFLGWGYASTQFILPQYALDIGHAPPHCHNTTLQVIFSVGWVGGIVFIGLLIAKLYAILSRRNSEILLLFVFITITGLTEASAFVGLANIATIIYAILFSMNAQQNNIVKPIEQIEIAHRE